MYVSLYIGLFYLHMYCLIVCVFVRMGVCMGVHGHLGMEVSRFGCWYACVCVHGGVGGCVRMGMCMFACLFYARLGVLVLTSLSLSGVLGRKGTKGMDPCSPP